MNSFINMKGYVSSMLNKHCITLSAICCCPFASKAVFFNSKRRTQNRSNSLKKRLSEAKGRQHIARR